LVIFPFTPHFVFLAIAFSAAEAPHAHLLTPLASADRSRICSGTATTERVAAIATEAIAGAAHTRLVDLEPNFSFWIGFWLLFFAFFVFLS
jgi:hypothetical protein